MRVWKLKRRALASRERKSRDSSGEAWNETKAKSPRNSLQFHWPGRGSGGSMSGTRPFGQPLVLMMAQETPSTSSPRTVEPPNRWTRGRKRWPWELDERPATFSKPQGIQKSLKRQLSFVVSRLWSRFQRRMDARECAELLGLGGTRIGRIAGVKRPEFDWNFF